MYVHCGQTRAAVFQSPFFSPRKLSAYGDYRAPAGLIFLGGYIFTYDVFAKSSQELKKKEYGLK